jgi:hypothetical protein
MQSKNNFGKELKYSSDKFFELKRADQNLKDENIFYINSTTFL